jgi:hypothetical protein
VLEDLQALKQNNVSGVGLHLFLLSEYVATVGPLSHPESPPASDGVYVAGTINVFPYPAQEPFPLTTVSQTSTAALHLL